MFIHSPLIWRFILLCGVTPCFAVNALGATTPLPQVTVIRTPDRGIQPQAVTGSDGTVHLVYFKGDPKAGDLFYTTRLAGQTGFTPPRPVNRKKGSAIAIGTIRGAQIALGRNDRLHVVWNGAENVLPEAKHSGAALWYTRLNDARTEFEPERDLITVAAGLDGGSSIAADRQGNVYAVWHARRPGSSTDEESRAVFVATSHDDGATFGTERAASPDTMGVCACCGLRAEVDGSGNLYALFRGASNLTNRDEFLLTAKNPGARFETMKIDPWISATCPMSSAHLAALDSGTVGAWESAGQVYFGTLTASEGLFGKPTAPSGAGSRKHPVVARNDRRQTLLVWTEGTGWEKGGSLAWQVFDAQRKPLADVQRADGVPVWSLAAVVLNADGGFTVIY